MNLPKFSGKHSHGKVETEILRVSLPFSMGPSSKCLPRDALLFCGLLLGIVDDPVHFSEQKLSPSLPEVQEDSGNVCARQNEHPWATC